MANSIKTAEVDIQIQLRVSQDGEKNLILVKINNAPWQETVLPSAIVKEKFIDAKFWKYLLNFL